ncbi:MAG TPA: c-type cytochrome, partial [Kofleriaceae bacterium]|nr:c-type cytochrome [Kofleriaceae bacterium]
MENKEIIALTAYLQRLGVDIKASHLSKVAANAPEPVPEAPNVPSACGPGHPTGAINIMRAYLDGAMIPSEPTAPRPTEDDALRARGAALYGTHCASCHGDKGDGKCPLGAKLEERPAAVAVKPYELRSTEHDALPTDLDLFRVITH